MPKQTSPVKIKVIIGSTREGRFSEKPARWIFEEVKKRSGVEAELLDLRDYPMPFFNDPISPSMKKGNYSNEVVAAWAKKIAEADAYIIVTPEYNHGYPAVLKNAMDFVYYEWNRKPVGFVSYGSVGGARSVEQLRQVSIELQMAPIRNAVHIPWQLMAIVNEKGAAAGLELFEPLRDSKENFLNQLVWWARALKTAREEDEKA
jgi:NAD(P)H-dependent FMN reductase